MTQDEFRSLKFNQKLFSIQLGWCWIVSVFDSNPDHEFWITVQDKDANERKYTKEGKYLTGDHSPSLFIKNPFIKRKSK